MPGGLAKDPVKRQAQIENGKKLAKFRAERIKTVGGRTTLTMKQKLFVRKYIENGFNGAKAALEVYDGKEKNAKIVAYDTLKKPLVKEELAAQLTKAGLGLDDLNSYTRQLIETNMEGKPSQAVAASMVQHSYKLHNVLPTSKKMTMNLSLHDQLPSKDFDEVKKTLEKLTETTNALLSEIKG